MKTSLFDAGPRPKWTGSRALVVIDTDRCPACGASLDRTRYSAAPLTVRDACRCGWALVREVSEVRP